MKTTEEQLDHLRSVMVRQNAAIKQLAEVLKDLGTYHFELKDIVTRMNDACIGMAETQLELIDRVAKLEKRAYGVN